MTRISGKADPSTPDSGSQRGIPAFMWGLGIMAGLVIVFNLFLVWKSTYMHEDMVMRDYYQAGLGYDSIITAQKRVDSLGLKVHISLVNGIAEVGWREKDASPGAGRFPVETGKNLRCEAYFYRPDSEKLDFSLAMVEDSLKSGLWKADIPPLKTGFWKITVQWYQDSGLWLEKRFLYSG